MKERKKWNKEKSESLKCIGCDKIFDANLLEHRCRVTIKGSVHDFVPKTWDICPECRKKPMAKEE